MLFHSQYSPSLCLGWQRSPVVAQECCKCAVNLRSCTDISQFEAMCHCHITRGKGNWFSLPWVTSQLGPAPHWIWGRSVGLPFQHKIRIMLSILQTPALRPFQTQVTSLHLLKQSQTFLCNLPFLLKFLFYPAHYLMDQLPFQQLLCF